MTVIIFLSVLLGTIILGVPVAFALLICGIALMLHLDFF
ncbi:DedA family integral membrane protein [Haemophilus influenzae]|nr:DedA family integral membrane protein [Haemophilus influenzae]CWX26079.1 DedA family integral membrane protein [Haemophilus influenzae]